MITSLFWLPRRVHGAAEPTYQLRISPRTIEEC
jgi:hypothetical protein